MKKVLLFISALCACFTLATCNITFPLSSNSENDSLQSESETSINESSSETASSVKPNSSSESESSSEADSSSEPDSSSESDSSSDQDSSEESSAHSYTDFTTEEQKLFLEYIGEVIPFIPNDEYYVEEYAFSDEEYTEIGLNFYTFDNTQAEFEAYLDTFDSYTPAGTEQDEYGDTWYYFDKNGFFVDLSFYEYEGECVVDVYAYILKEAGDSSDDSSEPLPPEDERYYTDFTAEEKALFIEYIGEVIPFVPNDEYYVEAYHDRDYDESGINFYAFGNTQAEFEAYLDTFNSYTPAGTEQDEYGDTWYYFDKNGFFVDLSFYEYEGEYVIDVYAYTTYNADLDNDGDDNNDGDSSDTPSENTEQITNAGKGLPSAKNGVYEVDFTKAENVKNVTDQGYYLDGCPTLSTNAANPAVLVIPVEFSDVTAASKGYTTEKLEKAFNGKTGETDYYSVDEYFYISSYGKLDLDITVLDSWFRPQYNSSYYEKFTIDYYGEELAAGDQLILHEALTQLEGTMDLSKYDSDGNGIIDSVVMIYTLDIDAESDFRWAYRYWNVYTDSEDYYYEYDGVSANDYLWASYQFLHESVDQNGDTSYTAADAINTYTYIHEFSHVLGADDYYDTSYTEHPLEGFDIMDSMTGDHNPFTKFNYGWLTSSRLIVAQESVTVTLEDFSKNGDTVIIANNWDEALGAYQEYYVLAYYKNTGLNGGEYGYFDKEGIVVYHVNASLYKETIDGETYYDIYNTNTHPSDENGYGTDDNLIELIQTSENEFIFGIGNTMSESTTDDQGNKLAYNFTVDALENEKATITFTKNA